MEGSAGQHNCPGRRARREVQLDAPLNVSFLEQSPTLGRNMRGRGWWRPWEGPWGALNLTRSLMPPFPGRTRGPQGLARASRLMFTQDAWAPAEQSRAALSRNSSWHHLQPVKLFRGGLEPLCPLGEADGLLSVQPFGRASLWV